MEGRLVAALWLAIIIVSAEQRAEFKAFVADLYGTYKHRKRIKNAIRTNECYYDNAKTDYLKGFYYGKIGSLKLELDEAKYFGKE